jgi:hypothetical protein
MRKEPIQNSLLKSLVYLSTFILMVLITQTSSFAQTTLIDPAGDGGFSNGSTFAANGWSSSSASNGAWLLGTPTVADPGAPFAGNKAFISNDGSGRVYNVANPVQSYFWRDITVPSGETKIQLSFNIDQVGESSWDIVQVIAVPNTSYTPIAANTHAGSGTTALPATPTVPWPVGSVVVANSVASTVLGTINVLLPSSLAGTSFRLIFLWKSDTSGGTTPPAAVDNISLVSSVPGTYTSVATGNWTAPATWDLGSVPSALDNVVIAAGHVVTIDAASLSTAGAVVQGTLAYGTTPTSFAINGNLAVQPGGLVNVFFTTTGKTLTVAGNINNAGTIDVSVGTTTAGNLTLNGSTVQTVAGAGTWTGGFIRNLTFANTSTTYPNINWSVNNIKVANNIIFTNSRVNLGSNTLFWGNNAAVGALTVTGASGFTSGTFGRYWTTAQTGTSIGAGVDPSTTTSRYPFITSDGINRSFFVERSSSSTTGNTAGDLLVTYNAGGAVNTGLSIVDGPYTVNQTSGFNYTMSTAGGYVYASGTHEVAIVAPFSFFPTAANTRVVNPTAAVGTHQAGTTTPGGQRAALTTAQLTAAAWHIGFADADLPKQTVAAGDWSSAATWQGGTVPVCADNVLIGHAVTVTSAGNVVKDVTIGSGGTLSLSAGDLVVGCTNNNANFVIATGVLNVSGGTLTVNGRLINNDNDLNQFIHSAGNVVVDGNSGTLATSVAVHITDFFCRTANQLQFTGGTFTVVDPPLSTTNTNCAFKVFPASTGNFGANPAWTLKFGNGSVTNDGGHSNGYLINVANTSLFKLGNLVVDAPGVTPTNNRLASVATTGLPLRNLTVTSGEFRIAITTYVDGNVTVSSGATLTTTSTLYFGNYVGTAVATGSAVSTLTNSGTMRNVTTGTASAEVVSLTVNTTGGLTLSSPVAVSSTLTMIKGKIFTTATNLLTLGTATAGGTLSTSSVFDNTTYIEGPFRRGHATTTASNTFDNTRLYPVGSGNRFKPFWLSPTLTVVGTYLTAEVGTNGGTPDAGVTNLGGDAWSVSASTLANMTNFHIGYGAAGVQPTNVLLRATTATGVYGATTTGSLYTAASGSTPNNLKSNPNGSPILVGNWAGFYSYGDITPCVTPADQATSLVFSQLGSTSLQVSFTAAASPVSGYLVVRYPFGTPPTLPVDGTSYAAGAGLGGTIVSFGSNLLHNVTGLTASTQYDFYVYTYNSVGCGGGPKYNTTSPLTGTVSTCATLVNPITALGTTARTQTSLSITWTASTTVGATYQIDVATDAAYQNIIQANINNGTATTYTIIGLSPETSYFFRVRAFDPISGCWSTNVSSSNSTLCAASNIPYNENINGALNCLSLSTSSGTAWGIVTGIATPTGFTGNAARASTSTTAATDNSFITRALNLVAGTSYDVTFRIGSSVANTNMNIAVQHNTVASNIGGTTIQTLTNISNNVTSNVYTMTFTVPSTGVYYVQWKATAPITGSVVFVYIDDIIVDVTPNCSASLGGTISSSNTTASCGNNMSTNLAGLGFSTGLGISYQWQKSIDNFVSDIQNIGGATNPFAAVGTFSVGTNYFRLATTCSNTSSTGFSNIVNTPYSNPSIATTTPATRCGTGTVTLGATATSGTASVNWFAASTGGAPLATNTTSFTTPSISTSTTYYAAAIDGGTTESAARSTYSGTDNTTGTQWGLVFNVVSSPITLNTVDVYSVGAGGTLTVELRDNAGALISTSAPFTYPSGTTGSPVTATVPLGFTIPVGTGYRLVMGSMGGALIRNSSLGGFPYTSASGNVVVTNGYISGLSTTYYWFYNWSVSSGCEGTRTPVVATVVSPPALTLSSNAQTICANSPSSLVTITSNVADYNTYTWAPATNVTGNQNDGYTFNPSTTTTYTLTAAQTSMALCQNVATVAVTVNPLPGITATPPTVSVACNTPQLLNAVLASQASAYPFSATSGTFTPITGGTDVNIIEDDDVSSALIPLGFNFVFEGTTYTNVVANSNGWLSFNPLAVSAAAADMRTNASTAPAGMLPLVAPLWDDLDGLDFGGAAKYVVTGTAPNRIFTMEWLNWEWNWQATAAVISFQVNLYETSNRVEFVYRQEAGAVNNSTLGASIGIMTSATNYKMLDGTGASPIASNSIFTTSLATKPANGQTYTFDRPTGTITWTPATNLFLDMAGTMAYTNQNVENVYTIPTANRTYVANTAADANGCIGRDTIVVTATGCSAILNLTSYIEGYMNGSTMRPVLLNSGVAGATGSQCDTFYVELRNATTPFGIAFDTFAVVGTNGLGTFTFPAAAIGNSYYIAVQHRNALETWSAAPVAITATTTYDFSTAATQAFGSNMVGLGAGGTAPFAFYSGDIESVAGDGAIDLLDYPVWEIDNNNFAFGYFRSDLNGDGSVDLLDYPTWEINNNNFVSVSKP